MLLFISTNAILKTQEERGNDANWTQKGRRSNAVQMQSRRRETPYGTAGMSTCNHWMHAINMEKTCQITFGCFRTGHDKKLN